MGKKKKAPGGVGNQHQRLGGGGAEAEGGFVTETVDCVRTLGEAAEKKKFCGIPESSTSVTWFLTFGFLCAPSHADVLMNVQNFH